MKKKIASRLTINTRKLIDTFDRLIGKTRKEKNHHIARKILILKDTYIQVPGTVVAAAATISDRKITSGPLPRIVILLLHPLQASKEIINFVLQVFAQRVEASY